MSDQEYLDRLGKRPDKPPVFVVSTGDEPDTWAVQLPHQCGTWDVTSDEYGLEHVPHEVAVQQLTRFILAATGALSDLTRRATHNELEDIL